VRWIGAALVAALIPAIVPSSMAAQSAGPATCARCGPAPMSPSWFCADGRHQGGRGPCVERRDGSCGWIRLVCPEDRPPSGAPSTCGPAECGAAPTIASWACPGGKGSGGFGACRRDREGRCGWVHQPCAGQAQGASPAAEPVAPPTPAPPPTPVVPPTPAAPPTPAVTRSCAHLPSVDEMRTWPVVAVCRPGGGPAPAPTARIRSLGDGTYVFSGRAGCFRGRYTRCFSK